MNGFLKAVLSRAAGLVMLLNENVHRSINLISSPGGSSPPRRTRRWKRFCVGGKVSPTFPLGRDIFPDSVQFLSEFSIVRSQFVFSAFVKRKTRIIEDI